MLVVALVGDADAPVQRPDTDPAVTLEGVIPLIGILHRWGAIMRWLIQSFKALFRDLLTAMLSIFQQLRPQPDVG